MAVLVALTGPTAFAEDVGADGTTTTTTEAASPDAGAVPASPTIASDKDDYPPGADVILTGADWQPGEIVHIRVNDDQGMTWRRDVDVSADGNGSIRDDFRLPDWFVAAYAVTATGPISGTATTSFTDANVTAATLSIRTAANATACTATSAVSFTAGDRACARSTITSLSNNNPGQTGGLSVLWVNPSGTTVATTTHIGAAGDSFDDTLVVNATGTWTVKACTNTSCPASALLASRTFTVNAATVVNTSTVASDATATYGDASVTLSATVSPNTVNVGTVTFTVNGSTATSGTVSGGLATASFSLSGVDAGTYTIAAAYSGGTGFNASNNSAQSPAPQLTVAKADADCTVTAYSVTYDADPHTATGTCTGVGGADLSADLDLSGTTHTAAGDYTDDPWSFDDTSGNYNDQAGTVDDSIGKADASCSISGYSGVYDANAHGATGSCEGVGGEDAGTLDLGDSFTDVPGGTAEWSFVGNGNYNDQDGSVEIEITKADATCVVTGYDVIYDAAAHTAEGSCTGVEDEALSGLDLSGTTHTAAGDYTADPWTFTDTTGNYNDITDGTVDDNIDKADATCVVTGYSVVYDGAAHTATGSCTGVGGAPLSGLNLSGTTHTAPADYPTDPWTFTAPNSNYNNDAGTVHDNIHYATGGTCLGSPGHQILQPIDNDGSSVFKQGSTVPAKFRVCDAAGHSIGTPGVVSSFRLVQTTNGTVTVVDEGVISTTPDTAFRWSPNDQQWIFNINTKTLSRNKTYLYRITLNDGSTIEFQFGLK